MVFQWVILGYSILSVVLFVLIVYATKVMHIHILIWKYFERISKWRKKKIIPIDGKIDECKMEELRYYLMSCLLWHYPPDRIEEACVQVGWERELVQAVLMKEHQKLYG